MAFLLGSITTKYAQAQYLIVFGQNMRDKSEAKLEASLNSSKSLEEQGNQVSRIRVNSDHSLFAPHRLFNYIGMNLTIKKAAMRIPEVQHAE